MHRSAGHLPLNINLLITMKVKFFSFLIPLFALISCAQNASEVHLDTYADGIEFIGIHEVYQVGEKAHVSLKIDDLLYRYPIPGEIQVYGSNDYFYDEITHDIDITMQKDTIIRIANTAKYGEKTDPMYAARILDERVAASPDATFSVSKASISYSLHTTGDSSDDYRMLLTTFLEQILGTKFEGYAPLEGNAEIPLDITFLPSDRMEFLATLLEIISTDGLRGRIVISNKDCVYLNNYEAAIDFHKVYMLKTKDLIISGRLIIHVNQYGFFDKIYLIMDDGSVYKNLNFCSGNYFNLEVE